MLSDRGCHPVEQVEHGYMFPTIGQMFLALTIATFSKKQGCNQRNDYEDNLTYTRKVPKALAAQPQQFCMASMFLPLRTTPFFLTRIPPFY